MSNEAKNSIPIGGLPDLWPSESYDGGRYDVIVVGAGHAGVEAAAAAARLGCETILFTLSMDCLANLPCNPSIGGTAKGQLVREIDALGGLMPEVADRAALQFRMLNSSKGPAVRSPRVQVDRRKYQEWMKVTLEKIPKLTLRQEEVTSLLYEPLAEAEGEARYTIQGVTTRLGARYMAPRVILCTGTYLDGRIHVGEAAWDSGPDQQMSSKHLSRSLVELDLPLQRFKTGTPVRVKHSTVNHEVMELQPGDPQMRTFSFKFDDLEDDERVDLGLIRSQDQMPCHIAWTHEAVHGLIRDNLDRSPMHRGDIEGIGARYCPSIEDKVTRFADKERHQLFLEPTGRLTEEIYVQGLSSSLPWDIQMKIVRSIQGLEQATIMRPAYAIEYTCIDPTALQLTLEVRAVQGLYGAGQFNGTSGYEEAAAQGLMAGLNAARSLQGKEPAILRRDQAYIGVLIDDLITKGTLEPYRMMTARAEYRLVLRQDNADQRLCALGYAWGLLPEERYQAYLTKQAQIDEFVQHLRSVTVPSNPTTAALLEAQGTSALKEACKLADLIARPQLGYEALQSLDPLPVDRYPRTVIEQAEIILKYDGYIRLDQQRIDKFKRQELRAIPEDLPYHEIRGLRIEARQKLAQRRPLSIGQASRISGVSPADIAVLLVYLEANHS